MYGTLISSVTVGAGGVANIEFTSIPQTYTDLCLVLSIRTSYANTFVGIVAQINSADDSGAVYRVLRGDGSSTYSSNATYGWMYYSQGNTATSNIFGNHQVYIPNYAGSAAKAISYDAVTENNASSASQSIGTFKTSTTTAVTSIKILEPFGSTIQQYSTAYLYGLTKGSGGATVS